MTRAEIITKFRNYVEDSLDEDLEIQLVNDAMNEIEDTRLWEKLKKETTYNVSAGTFSTAIGTLPTRFARDVRVVESDGNYDYVKVAFDDLISKKNEPFGYFIDLNAGNLHLAGENYSAKTIYFYYTEYSADLSSDSSEWQFPARFHNAIPLKMAELYYAVDAGEKARSWDDRWSLYYQRVIAQMEAWDDSLKAKNRRPYRGRTSYSPKAINI